MPDECKGCLSNYGASFICPVRISRLKRVKLDVCPCQTCLIKVMCSEACDEYKKLWPEDGWKQ